MYFSSGMFMCVHPCISLLWAGAPWLCPLQLLVQPGVRAESWLPQGHFQTPRDGADQQCGILHCWETVKCRQRKSVPWRHPGVEFLPMDCTFSNTFYRVPLLTGDTHNLEGGQVKNPPLGSWARHIWKIKPINLVSENKPLLLICC